MKAETCVLGGRVQTACMGCIDFTFPSTLIAIDNCADFHVDIDDEPSFSLFFAL
jgi:hypothetical protein